MTDVIRADGQTVSILAKGIFVAIIFPAAEERIETVPVLCAPRVIGSTFSVRWSIGPGEFLELSIPFTTFAQARSCGLAFVHEAALASQAGFPGGTIPT